MVSSRLIVGGGGGLEDGQRITVSGEDAMFAPQSAGQTSQRRRPPSRLPTEGSE